MNRTALALRVGLGLVALAGCGMPEGEDGDEAADDTEQVTGELLGRPRIACPPAIAVNGNAGEAQVTVGQGGLARSIVASIQSSTLSCAATGAVIPLAGFTTPPARFSLGVGQALSWAISGPRVTFTIKALGIPVGSSTFTCPTRTYRLAAALDWSFPTVTGTATPTVIRTASTVAVSCAYSLAASSVRVTQPRPPEITFASGNGFYRSSDLTTAEKTQICTPPCNTSCTSGFTGGHVDGIAECINQCIASCVSK